MGVRIDVDGVHALLWQMRMANGTVRVVQEGFAEQLQVTKHTLNRLLAKMVQENRLKQLTTSAAGVNTYEVHDPITWTRVRHSQVASDSTA